MRSPRKKGPEKPWTKPGGTPGIPQPQSSAWPARPAPMRSPPRGGLQGAPQLARQRGKKEVGRRGEKKVLEVGSGLLHGLPLSRNSRTGKWPMDLATQRWPSPPTRTFPGRWGQTGVGVGTGGEQTKGGRWRAEGLSASHQVVWGPRGPFQQRGREQVPQGGRGQAGGPGWGV